MAERFISPSTMASGPAQEAGLDPKSILNIVGALLSLALLIGVGVWSYKLIVRDVSGVPVVRAAEGPIRVQPASPGGQQAQHQGLSVNDVAAVGEASQPANRLILAPPPLALTAEDTPAEIRPTEAQVRREAPADLSPAAEQDDAVPADAAQAQLAALSAADTPQSPDPETGQMDMTGLGLTSEGLARSLRPRLRPDDLGNVGQAVALQVAAAQPIDPASVVPGTGMAQLGSFDSEALAQDAWISLSAQFSGFLNGKRQVIQSAENGGRQFYRLRALGFEDISDARRFCSALVAEGAECIPVISR
ncbi:MAG: SPOR domain-containing protein [Pseudomonadota bacterium]